MTITSVLVYVDNRKWYQFEYAFENILTFNKAEEFQFLLKPYQNRRMQCQMSYCDGHYTIFF